MTQKSEEIHALLNVIGEKQLDRICLKKNFSRYDEAKQAILVIADLILDSDENAKINIIEDMGTALSVSVESAHISVTDLARLSSSLGKATRFDIFPTSGGVGACIVFDGGFVNA